MSSSQDPITALEAELRRAGLNCAMPTWHVNPARAAWLDERLQRLVQDLARQHLAGHRRPAADQRARALPRAPA